MSAYSRKDRRLPEDINFHVRHPPTTWYGDKRVIQTNADCDWTDNRLAVLGTPYRYCGKKARWFCCDKFRCGEHQRAHMKEKRIMPEELMNSMAIEGAVRF